MDADDDRTEMTADQLREAVMYAGCVDPDSIDEDCLTWPGDAVVTWGDAGHSGAGWYLSCGEYPEEGSMFVGPNREPFPALAKLLSEIDARAAGLTDRGGR